MLKKIILTVIAVLTNVVLMAQPDCSVRTFTIRDGLAAHTISTIEQTGDGLMWFSTWNGLCCFDGYSFRTFRDNRGAEEVLSSNRFLTVRANSRRDIWCTSYDRRLYLFDTHECRYRNIGETIRKRYGEAPEIRTVFALANGHSWIIGRNGSANYCVDDSLVKQGEGIEQYTIKNRKLIGGNIKKAFLDQFGNEWLFTDRGAMTADGRVKSPVVYDWLVEAGQLVVMASPDGKLAVWTKGMTRERAVAVDGIRSISDMQKVDDRRVALATDRGVAIVDVKTGANHIVGLDGEAVTRVYVDSRKTIWAFTEGDGVWRVNGRMEPLRLQSTVVNRLDATVSDEPFFVEDGNGIVWAVPTHGTFSYYDAATDRLVPYKLQSQGVTGNALPVISRYFVDRQRNLWFSGTHDLALVNFNKRNFRFMSLVANEDTRSLFIARNGDTWLGASSGAVAVAAPDGSVKGYLNANGQIQPQFTPFSNKIYALFEDAKSRVWIGTKGDGIYLREPDGTMRHIKHTDDVNSIPSDDIYDFDVDPKGRIWVATYGGGPAVIDESGGSVVFRHAGNGISGYPLEAFGKVRRITHTKDGRMLLSTNGGLVVMTPSSRGFSYGTTVHRSHDAKGLMAGDVMQTLVTRSGSVYVITMGGGIQKIVSKNLAANNLDMASVAPLNRGEGMIQSAVEDKEGRIWVIRESSIDCYDAQKDSAVNYGIVEWGDKANFSEALPVVDAASGRVTVATMGGAISFDPKAMGKSVFRPNIVFTGVRYQGTDGVFPVLNTDELDVPSDRRNLTIYFSALDYKDNYQIRYAYKIEGKDDSWTYVGNSHSASFNNLPHGHLRLLVRSTNSDGVWMDNVRVLNIYSHPTFWETGWAKLLYLLIFCGLIALAIYIYTLRIKIKEMVVRWTEQLREMREKRVFNLENPEIIDPDEVMLKKLKDYLEQHIQDPDLKIDELSSAVNMGRSAFQTKIKELTGRTPGDFVKQMRIDRAEYLLINSQDNVNQIAYATGFSDPKYFSRVFKKETGMTPSQYRNERTSSASSEE